MRSAQWHRSLLVVCIVAVALGFGKSNTLDKDIQKRKRELELIQKELQQKKKEIDEARKKEKGVLSEITLLSQAMHRNELYINKLKDQESSLLSSLQETQQKIDSLRTSIDIQKSVLARRLKKMYQKGKPDFWELMLKGKSSTEIFENWYYMSRIVDYDKQLIARIAQTQNEMVESKNKLTLRVDEVEVAKNEQKEAQDALTNQQKDQKKTLQQIQSDRKFQEKVLKDFEANQKLIAEIIKNLEEKRRKRIEEEKRQAKLRAEQRERDLAKAKKMDDKQKASEIKKRLAEELAIKERVEKVNNQKCWPVKGEIISKYGIHIDPKIKTKTRNLGIEIRGALGTPVKSVTSGEVVMVGRLPGHGTGIVIDHGASFYSVYGHMKTVTIKSGQKVSVCQEIGSVGDEESYNGPKLFFQINKGVNNVDPMDWLKDAKR